MSKELKPASTLWMALQGGVRLALQVVDMRLALVIGFLAFVITVSFDAAGHPAEAADFGHRPGTESGLLPVTVVQRWERADLPASSGNVVALNPTTDQAINRQREPLSESHHGMITSASLIDDRITAAQLLPKRHFD